MKIPRVPHSWSVTPAQAVAIQRNLVTRVVCRGRVLPTRRRRRPGVLARRRSLRRRCRVWDAASRHHSSASPAEPCNSLTFPACLRFAGRLARGPKAITLQPDVFVFDGRVTPTRRFGCLSHGRVTGSTSIGCAKTILIGRCLQPAQRRVQQRPHRRWRASRIAIRTRDGVKPCT
jgi:hypothetical protein